MLCYLIINKLQFIDNLVGQRKYAVILL